MAQGGGTFYDYTVTVVLDNGTLYRYERHDDDLPGQSELFTCIQKSPDYPDVREIYDIKPLQQQIDRLPAPGTAPMWDERKKGGKRTTVVEGFSKRSNLGGYHARFLTAALIPALIVALIGAVTTWYLFTAMHERNPDILEDPTEDVPVSRMSLDPFEARDLRTMLDMFEEMAGTDQVVEISISQKRSSATMDIGDDLYVEVDYGILNEFNIEEPEPPMSSLPLKSFSIDDIDEDLIESLIAQHSATKEVTRVSIRFDMIEPTVPYIQHNFDGTEYVEEQ